MFFFSKYQMKTRVRLQFVKRPDLKTHLTWLEKIAQHLFQGCKGTAAKPTEYCD